MLGSAVGGSIQTVADDCQPRVLIMVDSYLDTLLGRLLPPRCVLCGARGQAPSLDLCRDCELDLPVDPAPLRHGPLPIDRCFAPFLYGFPVDGLVHRLKYRGQLAVGRVLGTLLAGALHDAGLHLDVDCLVPVPLHATRLAERGFNQAGEIGRKVARDLGLPFRTGAVCRDHATRPQVGLRPDERRANLTHAFRATGALPGRRVAVLDDVTTTGATGGEVARALRAAGAFSVDVWCIARAPSPERVDLRSSPEASPT
jgi:ComF family protein